MTGRSIIVLLALAAAAVTAAAGPAGAAARCGTLEKELRQVEAGGGAKTRQYAVSADRQRAALAAAERNARAAGCGGFFDGAGCSALQATIASMRSNLASLEAMAAGGSGSSRRERARQIRAQMQAAGCGGEAAPKASERENTAAPRAVAVAAAMPKPGAPVSGRPIDLSHFSRGTAYRTLCVRMCDGYYFPISWATRPAGFATDDYVCERRCPGAETQLFAHPTGSESDTAISVTGQPYGSLPQAFRYRHELVGGCGCEAAGTAGGGFAAAPVLEMLKLPSLAETEPTEPTDVAFETRRFTAPALPLAGTEIRRVGPDSLYDR